MEKKKSRKKKFDLVRDLVYIDSMAVMYNIHEAKTHFSRLIARVNGGEEIVIARAGVPVARLVPVDSGKTVRKPGSAKGKLKVSREFTRPLPPQVLKDFEK